MGSGAGDCRGLRHWDEDAAIEVTEDVGELRFAEEAEMNREGETMK